MSSQEDTRVLSTTKIREERYDRFNQLKDWLLRGLLIGWMLLQWGVPVCDEANFM